MYNKILAELGDVSHAACNQHYTITVQGVPWHVLMGVIQGRCVIF